MTLDEIALSLPGTDKGSRGHDYCRHYERHLRHLRNQRFDLLEVGTYKGDGLEMWAQWAPKAQIVGVDIAPQSASCHHVQVVEQDILLYQPEHEFDVIIDDGSHNPADVLDTWLALWPSVKKPGFYVIEDLAEQSGPGNPVTRMLKRLLAEMATGGGGPLASLHLYPQLAIMEKA